MMHGEFESMSALYSIVPDFVPKAHAWGSYKSIEDMHFFLCDFQYVNYSFSDMANHRCLQEIQFDCEHQLTINSDMTEELPDINRFTANVARLHLNSVSPNGKYGFHTTTYMGPLPQDNTWCDTWEEFFIRGMKRMLLLEEKAQGYNEELKELTTKMYEKVIPRLLRPLTVLNSIKPVLIHGDLWYGNCCTDNATDQPIVFDACAFWAHNECNHLFFFVWLAGNVFANYVEDEIGTWRAVRYRFGKQYINAYQKHYPISAPCEDHDDRNALYSM